MNYSDTIECVDSILKNISYEDYNLVIVDNCSTNGSGELLKNKYKNLENIHVIINSKNLGFAKGNNVGYLYAKKQLKSDFIILLNNDTIIKQENFLNNINEKYTDTNFHILGPDIVSLKDGLHQNPPKISISSISKVIVQILRFFVLLTLNYLCLEKIFRKIITRKSNHNIVHCDNNHENEQYGVKLHGSCLIFSPEYVNRYDGLYDKTFMYMEEDILHFIANRDNLRVVYWPELRIYHKEDSSTNYSITNNNKKLRFIYRNSLYSAIKLLTLMLNLERNC
jgi:GT2 family glycosyltransferase